MKYYVTGRVPGDDEDSGRALTAKNEAQARKMFEKWICAEGGDDPKETKKVYGQSAYINNVYCDMSDELAEALIAFLQASPCKNGCKKSDMTCASRFAEATLKKYKELSDE